MWAHVCGTCVGGRGRDLNTGDVFDGHFLWGTHLWVCGLHMWCLLQFRVRFLREFFARKMGDLRPKWVRSYGHVSLINGICWVRCETC